MSTSDSEVSPFAVLVVIEYCMCMVHEHSPAVSLGLVLPFLERVAWEHSRLAGDSARLRFCAAFESCEAARCVKMVSGHGHRDYCKSVPWAFSTLEAG